MGEIVLSTIPESGNVAAKYPIKEIIVGETMHKFSYKANEKGGHIAFIRVVI